nr:LacI family DNA-binding transcriptional regulator [Conexibacter sp. S30A1]
MTIRQVAELAGVSVATASRALNRRGDVSPDTRRLVAQAVATPRQSPAGRRARAPTGRRLTSSGACRPAR